MRALFGLDPDVAAGRLDAAEQFERALGFWSKSYWLQVMRGARARRSPACSAHAPRSTS